jgi:ribosomal protein S18 acetylase RimI-like enzyme
MAPDLRIGMEITSLRRLDYISENLYVEARSDESRVFTIRYGIIDPVPITCRKMHAADVPDAFHMLTDFLSADEHYLASSQAYGDLGLKGLNDALDLFLERPELGFVWMAYDENGVAGICVVCYAISTSMGAVVAKLDDVSVKTDRRGLGIGSELLNQLKEQLRKESVTRIDVAVHLENPQARRFYEKLGFVALNEERLSCLI